MSLKNSGVHCNFNLSVFKLMLDALDNPFNSISNYAEYSLSPLIDKRILKNLKSGLKGQNWEFKCSVAQNLRDIVGRSLIKEFTQALREKDDEVCAWAARSLGKLGDKSAVQPLTLVALKNEDSPVGWEALLALANLGDSSAITALNTRIRNGKEWFYEIETLESIRGIHNKSTIEALKTALNHEDPNARWGAALALARLSDSSGIEVLKPDLEEKYHDNHRILAAGALLMLGDPAAVEPLYAALTQEVGNYTLYTDFVLPALIDLPINRAVQLLKKRLVAALRDPDSNVRDGAVNALAVLGDKVAVPSILARLEDPRLDSSGPAWGLGKIVDKRMVQPLIAKLQHDYTCVKTCSAEALSRIGDRSAVEPLKALLDDEELEVRIWAVYALLKLLR